MLSPLPFAAASILCAVPPALMFLANLRVYTPPALGTVDLPSVSILIPARNEAHAIGDAVRAALATTGIGFEVVVMDDSSTDGTDAIVLALAEQDPRVRLEQAPPLPRGWNGKQHACWALAQAARNPILCFVDADVRLKPECVARMAAQMRAGKSSLISGFPQQITGTFLEWMLLPLIHFILLGFLPMERMRRSTDPSLAAGCGQFIMAIREDYFACGGHTGIKLTMHDGLRLPKLFRKHGFRTDLADITAFATCRMYMNAEQVWSGLAKNATEGLADPARIGPISLLLFTGEVLPFLLLAAWSANLPLDACIVAAIAAAYLPRILGVLRFKQDWRGAVLHPLGIVLLLCVQWYSLTRKLRGGTVSWKNRAYAGE
jgi:hypothetical protein